MRVLVSLRSHTYCSLCIFQWIDSRKVCPVCKEKIKSSKHLSSDLIPQKIIGDLEVSCAEKGCNWVGRNEDLRAHYVRCEERVKVLVQIPEHQEIIEILDEKSEVKVICIDD